VHKAFKENVRALSCIILFVTPSAPNVYASTDGFGLRAYYTKASTGEPFEQYSRTDKYADIKVNLGGDKGELVFCRGSSYLPYWQTSKGKWFLNEEIKRSGDGPQARPDKFNTFSQVKVVETNPARASVNWRYVPNMSLIEEKGWAEECLTVYPDGVLIRTIRKEYKELDDWEDPSNLIINKLMLTEDGVEPLASAWSSTSELSLSGSSASDYVQKDFDETKRAYVLRLKQNGLPSNLSLAVGAGVRNPVLFIENLGDVAVESIKMNCEEFKDYRVGYPVKEIEKLHVREHVWIDEKLEPGQNILSNIRGELFDIDAEFEVDEAGDFGFVINCSSIVYDSKENELSCGEETARLKPINGKIKLRILVDRVSIEIFANSGRIYMPVEANHEGNKKGLEVFTKSGDTEISTLKVYELQSIWN